MPHDARSREPGAAHWLIALSFAASLGCGADPGSAPAAGAMPAAHAASDAAAAAAPDVAEAPASRSPAAQESAAPREPRAGSRDDQASTDPFNVIEVEITAPKPFRLKLRVQPELAPDLASAVLKLDRTTFTVAGRPIDVADNHLQVCGIGFGPLATGDVVTLARGEVRVENVFRGPLPAPVAPR